MLHFYLLTFCRIVIGLTFAYAFLAKVRDISGFTQTIITFNLLPSGRERQAALLFLGGEAVVVVLIILGGQLLLLAFVLASVLMALFSLALFSVLRRNIETSCNCFGFSEKPITYYAVWRNIALVGCSLLGWWLVSKDAGSLAAHNWLAVVWQGMITIESGSWLSALLVVSAILTWLVLLPTVFLMLLLAKRLRQLDGRSPKEYVLNEAISRRGESAPRFMAKGMNDEFVTLDSFRDKAVAFLFLSPSCKPCVEKVPAFNDYYRRGAANGMEMIIVNVDHNISSETFAQQHDVQLPILWAPELTNPFARDYGAYSVPSFCLVDAKQRIRAGGRLDAHYWQDQLALMWS